CDALPHVAFGKQDLLDAEPGQDPGLLRRVDLGDDAANAEFPERQGAENGGVEVADGVEDDLVAADVEGPEGLAVGGVCLDGFGDLGADVLDGGEVAVDSEDAMAQLRQGAGDRVSEQAEAEDRV